MSKNKLKFLVVFALALTSCEYTQTGVAARDPAAQSDPGNPTPTPSPSPTPKASPSPTPKPTPTATPTATPSANSLKPLWESSSKVKIGSLLTSHVMNTLDTLGKDMMSITPADYATFCPAFTTLTYTEKKEVFAYMMSAMVKYESGFDTNQSYRENFKDSSGNYVVSRGLLQISLESGNAYGCGLKTEQDLHDPYQNLSCGIRILNRWIGQRDLRIAGQVSGAWKGASRYWSVMRSTNSPYASIVSLVKGTALCATKAN